MTDAELRDLRAWAAEVCGYFGYWLDDEWGYANCDEEWISKKTWLPDQNIAQAFEVLDAVAARDNATATIETDKDGTSVMLLSDSYGEVNAEHESRCLAILLACKAAIEANLD